MLQLVDDRSSWTANTTRFTESDISPKFEYLRQSTSNSATVVSNDSHNSSASSSSLSSPSSGISFSLLPSVKSSPPLQSWTSSSHLPPATQSSSFSTSIPNRNDYNSSALTKPGQQNSRISASSFSRTVLPSPPTSPRTTLNGVNNSCIKQDSGREESRYVSHHTAFTDKSTNSSTSNIHSPLLLLPIEQVARENNSTEISRTATAKELGLGTAKETLASLSESSSSPPVDSVVGRPSHHQQQQQKPHTSTSRPFYSPSSASSPLSRSPEYSSVLSATLPNSNTPAAPLSASPSIRRPNPLNVSSLLSHPPPVPENQQDSQRAAGNRLSTTPPPKPPLQQHHHHHHHHQKQQSSSGAYSHYSTGTSSSSQEFRPFVNSNNCNSNIRGPVNLSSSSSSPRVSPDRTVYAAISNQAGRQSPILPPLTRISTAVASTANTTTSRDRQSTISPVVGGLDRLGILSRHSSPAIRDRSLSPGHSNSKIQPQQASKLTTDTLIHQHHNHHHHPPSHPSSSSYLASASVSASSPTKHVSNGNRNNVGLANQEPDESVLALAALAHKAVTAIKGRVKVPMPTTAAVSRLRATEHPQPHHGARGTGSPNGRISIDNNNDNMSEDNDNDDDDDDNASVSSYMKPLLYETNRGTKVVISRDGSPALTDPHLEAPGSPVPGPKPLPIGPDRRRLIGDGQADSVLVFHMGDGNHAVVAHKAGEQSHLQHPVSSNVSEVDGGEDENLKRSEGGDGKKESSNNTSNSNNNNNRAGAAKEEPNGSSSSTNNNSETTNHDNSTKMNGIKEEGGNHNSNNGGGGGDDGKRPRKPSGHEDDVKMDLDDDDNVGNINNSSEGARKKRKLEAAATTTTQTEEETAISGLLDIGQTSPNNTYTQASTTSIIVASAVAAINNLSTANSGPPINSTMDHLATASADDTQFSNSNIDPSLQDIPNKQRFTTPTRDDKLPPMQAYTPHQSPSDERPGSQHSQGDGKGTTLPNIGLLVKAIEGSPEHQQQPSYGVSRIQTQQQQQQQQQQQPNSTRGKSSEPMAGYGGDHTRPPLHHLSTQQRETYVSQSRGGHVAATAAQQPGIPPPPPPHVHPHGYYPSYPQGEGHGEGPSPINTVSPFQLPQQSGSRDVQMTSPTQYQQSPYFGSPPSQYSRRESQGSISAAPIEWSGSPYTNSELAGPSTGGTVSTEDTMMTSPTTRTPRNRQNLDPQLAGGATPAGGFKCDYDGCKAPPFQTQYLLNSHANVHSQARPHFCPVKECPRGEGGKGFKRKNEMIRHGLVHQSPGYACPFCPDREHKYPRPDNLQRHVRVHHPDKDRDDPKLREVLAQRPEGGQRGRRRRGPG